MTDASISFKAPSTIDATTDVVVIGAGACGLVAALKAKEGGADVLVLERDASPAGSTSMSSGFVPAAATRFQKSIGTNGDSPLQFAADIGDKSKDLADRDLTKLATQHIGEALEWLADRHGLEWIVLDDFLYPGHSHHRMHTVPEKTGAALHARLMKAIQCSDISVVTNARATTLYVSEDKSIIAVSVQRPDGAVETIGCNALILACNGYGGNGELVRKYIPEIATGVYYGHAGNKGDAIIWGEQLGAKIKHLSGYQGHGSLAHPHGILITWAVMMEGGIQVNLDAKRFSNELGGYSEQAVAVLSQPSGVAWNIYDQRIHEFAMSFPDYRDALEVHAVKQAEDIPQLAERTNLPLHVLEETFAEISAMRAAQTDDHFGRTFHDAHQFVAPYFAVKVTGALFHTQGGLVINQQAKVVDENNVPFANLFAGGGAACGVSGPDVSGYLSGNGLLTAIAFGFVAGCYACC